MPAEHWVLSKTKYLAGLQCPKLLWMYYHAKDKFPPVNAQTQAIFDQGHEVTGLARTLFHGGLEVEGHEDYEAILKKTQELLPMRKPLFEPAFRYKNTFARPDILNPNQDGSWDIYEVKSSTEAKDVYYSDLAFQKYCYQGAGLKIRRCYLVLINNEYVRKGPINPEQLFSIENVSKEVEPYEAIVPQELERMLTSLSLKACPAVKIGPHCLKPYECALVEHCWDFLPGENVFILYGFKKDKEFQLVDKKIYGISDIPADYPLSDNQRIQWQCHKSKRTHRNPSSINDFFKQLEFPLHFLDFETVNPAIPFYDLSRPYQNVPFQFSLHILSEWERAPVHHGYLADGPEDPRPLLLQKLRRLIEPRGTVLSYNMSFELGRLEECVEAFSEYQTWFEKLKPRFRDLIDPFRQFDYYDPKQLGRTSIKAVYPALTGGSYEGLEIADGESASYQYARVTFREGIPEEEKARVRAGLEVYCKLDTRAMIDVLNVLKKAADGQA